MTGAKAWRQKGTGRARVGALSTPQPHRRRRDLRPQAARLHGQGQPQGARRALRAALSLHAERGSLAVVDPSAFDTPSTKAAAAALAGLDGRGRVLVVLAPEGEETCAKSFRNLAGVTVLHADAVGVADVVGAARLVVSEAALERLTELGRAVGAATEASVNARAA